MRGLCQRLALYLSLCLSLLLYAAPASAASVLAIDYGADFIKASLMKPGIPFDVLLNKDSKRKIHSSVAWKKGERLFGQDAYNLAARFPKDTYNHLKYLLGAPANADIVSYYNTISTSTQVASSRFTVGVPQPGGKVWDIEELVAAQLAYIRQLASDAAGETVRDAVLTVPPYFSQFERDALADAAELAGLKLITLVSDSAGVAVNFAMTRTFSITPEYHVIFDAGGGSTRATVVAFSQDAKGKSMQVALKGVGWDRAVSGTEFTRRVREMLVAEFTKKHPSINIRDDKRAMARLWKEADRVKGILSANNEASSNVESLIDEIDFKTKISRTNFEAKCKDLQPSFTRPLFDALANANLTMNDVKSVILFGGNTRVPMMRRAIDAAAGSDKVAVNVNADEAAVLGAALHGAALSHSFRTKDIKLSDILPYDVQVAYAAEAKEGTSPRTIHNLAFAAGSKAGTRKTMSFKRQDDFTLAFQYKKPVAPGFPVEFLEARIGGVKEALANVTAENGSDAVIKATLSLSDSGFVAVPEAFVVADAKDDSIAGKLKGLFGDKAGSEKGDETPSPSPSTTGPPKAAKTLSIPLTVSVKYPTVAPMGLEQKREARKRLNEQEAKEAAIAMREDQRNGLEGYIYRLRDLVGGSEQQPFIKCSKPSERSEISKTLEEVREWFNEHQDTAETKEIIEKRGLLQALENPIQHRYKEIEEFPTALNESQKWNFHTRMFLGEARANLTREAEEGVEGKFTREELEGIAKALEEHETWLGAKLEAQRKNRMDEDPVVETKEMRERAKVLELHLQRLIGKKPPRKKIPTATASVSFTTPSASSTESAKPKAPHEEL